MTSVSLGHLPGGAWRFDAAVADCFDDMLERSIPQYRVMRDLVYKVGGYFAGPDATIVDLGCSLGGAIARFAEEANDRRAYYGYEISEPMLAGARNRFLGYDNVHLYAADVSSSYPSVMADLTLSVLTMMFIPAELRALLCRNVFLHTKPGGAYIFVEKICSDSPRMDNLQTLVYHAMKHENGYSDEAVERKRLALQNVLIPLTPEANVAMLHAAGFSRVECFWRWMNFTAWVAFTD